MNYIIYGTMIKQNGINYTVKKNMQILIIKSNKQERKKNKKEFENKQNKIAMFISLN